MDGMLGRAMLIFEGSSSSSSHGPGATPCRKPASPVAVSRAAAQMARAAGWLLAIAACVSSPPRSAAL